MAYRKKASKSRSYSSGGRSSGRGAVKRNTVSRRPKRRATTKRPVRKSAVQTIRIVMETMPQAYAARPEGMLVPQTQATKPRKAKF